MERCPPALAGTDGSAARYTRRRVCRGNAGSRCRTILRSPARLETARRPGGGLVAGNTGAHSDWRRQTYVELDRRDLLLELAKGHHAVNRTSAVPNDFVDRYNHELVDIHRINTEALEAHRHHLRTVIEEFVQETESEWGQNLLDNFDDYIGKFWLVKPKAAALGGLLVSFRKRRPRPAWVTWVSRSDCIIYPPSFPGASNSGWPSPEL